MDKIKKNFRERKTKYNNNVIVWQGVKFDSELEMYCHQYLDKAGFTFHFQKRIELLPALKRSKEFVTLANSVWQEPAKNALGKKQKAILRVKNEQNIDIVVDFFLEGNDFDVTIDTKGVETQTWIDKIKTLEFHLAQKEKPTLVFTPNNKNQVIAICTKLKKHFIL